MISKELIDVFASHGTATGALHDKLDDRQNRIKMLFSKSMQSATLVLEALSRLRVEDFSKEVLANHTIRGDESAVVIWPDIIDKCQPNFYQNLFHPEPKTNVVTAFDQVVEESLQKDKDNLQLIPHGVWYVVFTEELIELHFLDGQLPAIFDLNDLSLKDIDNGKPEKALTAMQTFSDILMVIGEVIFVAVSKTSTSILETFHAEIEDQYPDRDLSVLEADIGRKPFSFHFNVPD